jgi:Uma2 family endonuclease
MAVPARVRFLPDDIWDTPEDGNRYEVIDGELYVTPPPIEPHQNVSSVLHSLLGPYIREHKLGKFYSAPIGVVLPGGSSGVQPDLVYVANERRDIIVRRGIEGAPDLVVEILSPSTRARDRGIKMRAYATAGVPHYWILDPRTRSLEPYRLGEQGYERQGTYGPGTTFRPDLFPGLEIPIDDLWD